VVRRSVQFLVTVKKTVRYGDGVGGALPPRTASKKKGEGPLAPHAIFIRYPATRYTFRRRRMNRSVAGGNAQRHQQRPAGVGKLRIPATNTGLFYRLPGTPADLACKVGRVTASARRARQAAVSRTVAVVVLLACIYTSSTCRITQLPVRRPLSELLPLRDQSVDVTQTTGPPFPKDTPVRDPLTERTRGRLPPAPRMARTRAYSTARCGNPNRCMFSANERSILVYQMCK